MSYRKRNFEKLIIQIPCYNEAEHLGSGLAELPREVEGFTTVEWLVIDDGSTDGTVEVAEGGGVDWIVRQPRNMGLARAFSAGVEAALEVGADVIVNTDGDNQYCSRDIPTLVAPILAGKADLVIGTRPISKIEHFSRLKKLLQKLGSWVVRQVSQTDVPDSPSGFRAFSRGAAIRLNVFSEYTYTLETIIQAGLDGLVVSSVPIRTNRPLRESRLVKNVPSYLWQSAVTIVRIFLTYRPLRFFWLLGSLPLGLGALLGIRWMILSLGAPQSTNIPSLIAAAILINVGFQLFLVGLLADLLAANRKLVQETRSRLHRMVIEKTSAETEKASLTRATPLSRETEKLQS